jgi:glycerophosphoryl diester phosphodiesterase
VADARPHGGLDNDIALKARRQVRERKERHGEPARRGAIAHRRQPGGQRLRRPSGSGHHPSSETTNLRAFAARTDVDLAQLINCSGAPYDLVAAGDVRTYADLVTRAGLADIATYANGVGLCKDVMIPRRADGTLGAPTGVIAGTHKAHLVVNGWTFRRENQFLPAEFRSSSDPNAAGNLVGEIEVFLAAGMDGFFTDNPDIGVSAVTD